MTMLVLMLMMMMMNDDEDESIPGPFFRSRALEREFELSRKAKKAAGKAKQAVQKVDSEYSVRQRAKEAARRTVRAAQRTGRDLKVSERAAGAAKATEQVCVQGGGGGEARLLLSLRAHAFVRLVAKLCLVLNMVVFF